MSNKLSAVGTTSTSPALTDTAVGIQTPGTTPADVRTPWTNILSLIFSNNSVGAAQTYTPTLGNITIGTGGTVSGWYRQIGKMVWCMGIVNFGTSGAISGATNISLPVTGNANYNSTWGGLFYGRCQMISNTGTIVAGDCRANSSTGTFLSVDNVTGTYPAAVIVTTGVPFTWQSGCQFSWNLFYEAA